MLMEMGSAQGPSRGKARGLTDAGFAEVAEIFKLLADPSRLKVLYALRNGPLSVGEVAEFLDVPQPTASRQLSRLQQGGLLARHRDGPVVYYSVADPSIYALCEEVCGGLERKLRRKPDELFL